MPKKKYTMEKKAKIVLEVLREQRTANEIAGQHGVTPGQLSEWKQQALQGLPGLFARSPCTKDKAHEELTERLYKQIGQLQVELDWLKKKSGCAP